MGHLTFGYKLDPQGKYVMHARFDSDQIPAGWFDSPEKCLAASGGVMLAPAPEPKASPDPAPAPAPIGEKRRPGRPRKAA